MNEDSKKLAIVTGAARGIGLATALMFNENGYKVAIVDNDKKEIDNLSFKNENLKTFCFDISNDDELEKMYSQILKWHNRIDVLVNNAGVADFGNIEETNFKRWNEVMKTNKMLLKLLTLSRMLWLLLHLHNQSQSQQMTMELTKVHK